MADPESAPVPRPRRGWVIPSLRAALATVLVLVLVGVAAIPWWLSDPVRFGRVVAWAAPGLDADVEVERVRVGWSGPLVLEGVTLVPRAGGDPPVVIRRIEGTHGLAAIALSGGDLGRLRVDGLEVDVVFDERHRTNLERLARPAAGDAVPEARRSPVRLRLEVDDALVRITAPWTTEPWVSEPLDVRLALVTPAQGPSEWRLEPVELLTDARLDPPVAWGVLAYVAPVLADATRTSGRFSLALDGATLPLGDPASGSLSGTLSMHEVVVGPGPLVTSMFASLPGGLPVPPAIRVADESHVRFKLAERRMWHEGLAFGVPLPGQGRRLDVRSQGSVGLADQSLDIDLALPIPGDLRQDRPLLAALAGKTITLGVGGRLGEPSIEFDGSIRQVAGQVAVDLLERVRGGQPRPVPPPAPGLEPIGGPKPADEVRPAGGEEPAGTPPAVDQAAAGPAAVGEQPSGVTADAVVDIVGGILDEVARRRAERQAAGEPPVLPRRGRLRQRLLGPGEPAAPAAGPVEQSPAAPTSPSPPSPRPGD